MHLFIFSKAVQWAGFIHLSLVKDQTRAKSRANIGILLVTYNYMQKVH